MDLDYNRQTHSETGQAPDARWREGIERVEYVDERQMRLAFRWCEHRTPDKAGEVRIPSGVPGVSFRPTLGLGHYTVTGSPEQLSSFWIFSWLR